MVEKRQLEGDWRAGYCSKNGKKLIEFIAERDSDDNSDRNEDCSDKVFAPLSLLSALPAREEPAFENHKRGEDDQRVRKDKVDAERNLKNPDDGTGRQIKRDCCLCI